MSKKMSMISQLKNGIHRPNVWVLTQGYLWVKRYLHDPIIYLRKSILKHQNTKQLTMLYDACCTLGDINYILDSYKTAYRWYSLAYKIDSSTGTMVEDMIDVSQRSGITKKLGQYIRRYLALNSDHKADDLFLACDADDGNTLFLLDNLNMFHPKKVIETITDERDIGLRLIKTLAYGAAQDRDVFLKRFLCQVKAGMIIRSRHLFYCPLAVLDSPNFWSMIIEYKPEIVTESCDFNTLISNRKLPSEYHLQYAKEYEDMPPFLHLARTEQDIEKMEALTQRYPEWKDPALCVLFFRSHGMMPKWKDFYCLAEPSFPPHLL